VTEPEKITRAITRVQAEVPKLAGLKLVFGLELTVGGLTGPGKSERYRIELPGPKISEGAGEDERLLITIPRTMFDLLADEGRLVDWREAFHTKHLKVSGDSRVMRLVGRAIGSS
jgi:hypothetical protein